MLVVVGAVQRGAVQWSVSGVWGLATRVQGVSVLWGVSGSVQCQCAVCSVSGRCLGPTQTHTGGQSTHSIPVHIYQNNYRIANSVC